MQEVGMPADYVNKLARMFQDIKVSEDLNQAFKEMHKNNKLALPGTFFLFILNKIVSIITCMKLDLYLLIRAPFSTGCVLHSSSLKCFSIVLFVCFLQLIL